MPPTRSCSAYPRRSLRTPRLPPAALPSARMGLSDVWNRTLVYFGIAEDEDWDEDALATQEEVERQTRSRSSRHNVRQLPRSKEPDTWSAGDSSAEAPPSA